MYPSNLGGPRLERSRIGPPDNGVAVARQIPAAAGRGGPPERHETGLSAHPRVL